MLRRMIVRTIGVLLIVNGAAGLAAVWVGWQATEQLLSDLRWATSTSPPEQARLVDGIHEVARLIDDSATATDGFARSMGRARAAIGDGSQAVDELGVTFEQLGVATQVTLFGARPLEGLTEPFMTSASSFRRLGGSLAMAGDSLADNARDTARVANDLRDVHTRLASIASDAEAFRPAAMVRGGISGLDLTIHLLLGLIALEALLSALTGLALLLLSGGKTVVSSGEVVVGAN